MALCVLCLSALAPDVHAAGRGMDFRFYEIVPVDPGFVVNASVDLPQGNRLQDLVEGGLSLPFQAEFTLTRNRWYWLNETVIERTIEYRLFYYALTRQYRVSIGSLHRNYSSFDEALRSMLSVRNWSILDRNNLIAGEIYQASLRFKLDVAQLPKPFQVAALGNRDLDMSTGWVHWPFMAPSPEAR